MIRDTHWHYADADDAIGLEDTVGFFDASMKKFGIEKATVLAIPFWTPGTQSILSGLTALWIKDQMHRRIFTYMGLWHNFDETDTAQGYVEQLERGLEMGFDGVKFFEGKPGQRRRFNRRLDDPILDPFYQKMEESGIPLLMHANDPKSNWDPEKISEDAKSGGWFYGTGDYRTFDEVFGEVEGIVNKHPKLKLILAHFFFIADELDLAADFLEKHPNVMFDLAPGTEMFEYFSETPEQTKAFFEKYSDRIFYGTDYENFYDRVWRDGNMHIVQNFLTANKPFTSYHKIKVNPIGLKNEYVENIYRNNHIRLNGEMPKETNAERIRDEIRRIESLEWNFREREKYELSVIKKYYGG